MEIANIISALRAHQKHKPLIRKTFSRHSISRVVTRSEF
jgi:hypothetical protein